MTTLTHSAATSFRNRVDPTPPRDGSDRDGLTSLSSIMRPVFSRRSPSSSRPASVGGSAFRLRRDATVCLSPSDPVSLMVK